MVTGGSTSANDSTYGSILCYYASRFPSSFKIPTSFYNSIVGMYVRSTSSGSVSETADIGSRSVSGSIRSMYGASVSTSSTPVISSSHIVRLLRPRRSRSVGCPWLSAFTRAIRVSGIGISYQLRLTTFFMDPRVMNFNPPCLFPSETMQIATLVQGPLLFR